MIAAVSNRALMRFMLYECALNADLFLDFLRPLVRDAARKVVLVVYNLKVHKACKVRAWLEGHAHEIELVYLPSYAPYHNPAEHLNNYLKQQLRQQPQPDRKDELVRNTRSVLRTIQRSPERVRAYFKPEPCATPPDVSYQDVEVSGGPRPRPPHPRPSRGRPRARGPPPRSRPASGPPRAPAARRAR